MHLSEIKISNFLAYVDAELTLGTNGLVLVIGPNNAGKSALLAALDVVADNVRGGNWRRAGSTEFAHVSATFTIDDDGERDFILGADAHPEWMQLLRAIRFEWEDRTASEMLLTSISLFSGEGVIGTVFSADYSSTGSSFNAVARPVFAQAPDQANWSLEGLLNTSPAADPMPETAKFLPGLAERLEAWRQSYFHFAPIRTGSSERSQLRDVVPKLDATGANLAQALLYHQSRSAGQWRDITEIVNTIIPKPARSRRALAATRSKSYSRTPRPAPPST